MNLNDYIRDRAGRVDVRPGMTKATFNDHVRRVAAGESVPLPAEPDTETQAGSGSADAGKGLEVNQGGPKPPTFDNLIRDLRG